MLLEIAIRRGLQLDSFRLLEGLHGIVEHATFSRAHTCRYVMERVVDSSIAPRTLMTMTDFSVSCWSNSIQDRTKTFKCFAIRVSAKLEKQFHSETVYIHVL